MTFSRARIVNGLAFLFLQRVLQRKVGDSKGLFIQLEILEMDL